MGHILCLIMMLLSSIAFFALLYREKQKIKKEREKERAMFEKGVV